ncbi:hypothetical protein HXX76_010743 [Chlamydomonas incerta]|uniref:Uncharacterized protein n=1 Tax=Chlamydomonas incerta TaxID=51695 RepID=A0A835VXH6_CHLIN|nr:hypothetical protein HXX76_010743 [Chlamydomonas incerta]|eukprot:KAG2429508.1 hypothetical protein HXX76_010743 [Chlamydomonas incerta]
MTSHASESSHTTQSALPEYIVNDKGFLTVRPAALQDAHAGLARRAAKAAAQLLAACAPDRLGEGGSASAATYALSMMVHSTNVLWWHLGPYDECSRSQRVWVVVSGKATSGTGTGTAKLKLPGGDRTVPLAELRPGLEEVAWELHALMVQMVRSYQRQQQQQPAGIEDVLHNIRNMCATNTSATTRASNSAGSGSDRCGRSGAPSSCTAASAPPEAGALPRPSPALMTGVGVGSSGSSTCGSGGSSACDSSNTVVGSLSSAALSSALGGGGSGGGAASSSSGAAFSEDGGGGGGGGRVEQLAAQVAALAAAVEQLTLLVMRQQQQPAAPPTPPTPSNADRRERWR